MLQDSFVGLSFQTRSEHTCFFYVSLIHFSFTLLNIDLNWGDRRKEKKSDLETKQLSTEKECGSRLNKKWMHHHMDVIFSVSKELQGLSPFETGPVGI